MKKNKKAPAPVDWQRIAEFYAGRKLNPIRYDLAGGRDGTTGLPESGDLILSPTIKKSLDNFVKYGPRSQSGMVMGARGLSTLLHEATHNRDFRGTDFKGADDEIQARDLGWRLIPDMLQRFFGVDMNSNWGRKYTEMVMKTLRNNG